MAYSLYGVLNDWKGGRKTGCTSDTYINSFVTTGGVESFSSALARVGVPNFVVTDARRGEQDGEENQGDTMKVTAACYGDEDFDYDTYYVGDDDNAQQEGEEKSKYLAPYHYTKGKQSIGTVCAGSTFAKVQFDGGFCQASQVSQVLDSLATFNDEISSSGCVLIYNSTEDYSQYQNNNRNGEEEEEGEESEHAEENNKLPVERLLTSSKNCIPSLDSPCPDPHGHLAAYTRHLDRSSHAVNDVSRSHRRRRYCSWAMLASGLAFVLGSLFLVWNEHNRTENKKMRKKRRINRKTVGTADEDGGLNYTKPSVAVTDRAAENKQGSGLGKARLGQKVGLGAAVAGLAAGATSMVRKKGNKGEDSEDNVAASSPTRSTVSGTCEMPHVSSDGRLPPNQEVVYGGHEATRGGVNASSVPSKDAVALAATTGTVAASTGAAATGHSSLHHDDNHPGGHFTGGKATTQHATGSPAHGINSTDAAANSSSAQARAEAAMRKAGINPPKSPTSPRGRKDLKTPPTSPKSGRKGFFGGMFHKKSKSTTGK